MNETLIERPIKIVPLSSITPYAQNAKKHSAKQVAEIAASMREFGWLTSKAIEITPGGVIINGHGRRLAAISLGMKEVPVVIRDDLKTEAQIKAYRLVDNKVAESDYDTELMAGELKSLHLDMNFDMSRFFSDKELEFSMDDLGDIDMSALTDDLEEQVKEQSSDTAQALEAEGSKLTPIQKILTGMLNATQVRALTRFIAAAEHETGFKGADALIAYLSRLTANNTKG